MNLNDDKNILLAKKGVYAEQLYQYSKLCQIYQDLAKNLKERLEKSGYTISELPNPDDDKTITSEEFKNFMLNKYSAPLSKIVENKGNNLDETIKNLLYTVEGDSDISFLTRKYTTFELDSFQKYAHHIEIFEDFKKVSADLDRASASKSDDRNKALSRMHKHLTHSNTKSVRNFDKLISVHSPRFLGARFFLLAKDSISNINQIDPNHISSDFDFTISQNLSPEKFGASITGYKTIVRNIDILEQHKKTTTRHYDPDNWNLEANLNYLGTSSSKDTMEDAKKRNAMQLRGEEAEDEFNSVKHSKKESLYVVYNAHKGTFRKAAMVAVGVATIISGIAVGNQIHKEFVANNLNLNNSTKYEQTIQDSTKDYLNSIIADLKLQSNSFDPQYEDVSKIEQNIDLVLDYIVRDQVKTAFEEYHEGYTVTEVNHWFDKKYEGSTSSGPEDYQFIDVYYVDDKGKEGMESIHDLRSDFFSTDPLQELFAVEEDIDLNSPVWKAFHDDGTKNFLANAQEKQEVMQYLEDATKIAQHFASFSLEHGHTFISNKPYFKSVLSEEKGDAR